jgi:hypothetical protein
MSGDVERGSSSQDDGLPGEAPTLDLEGDR